MRNNRSRKLILSILVIFILPSLCFANGNNEVNEVVEANVVNNNSIENVNKEDVMSNNIENSNTLFLKIGSETLSATLVENSSTAALKELLADGPLTISMRDYGNMEKVGSFGTNLPTNNQQITTGPGDLILYQGSAFVIYYAPNSWNFTRLGKIDNINQAELKRVLGSGSVDVTLSLE